MKKKIISAALASACAATALNAPAKAVTIASIYGTGDVAGPVTGITGTVTSILDSYNGSNSFVVSDGTGSVIVYSLPATSYSPTVGDNITFNSTNAPYKGAPELTKTAFSLTSTNSTGNPVSPTVLTIPQFNAAGDGSAAAIAPNAESLVTLDNVYLPAGTTTITAGTSASTELTLSDGTNTTILFPYSNYSNVKAAVTAANAAEIASNDELYAGPLDITGYADVFNGVSEFYPTGFVGVPEPTSLGVIGLGAICMLRRRRQIV